MATSKYLDLAGLKKYDELIKAFIGTIPAGATQKDVISYLTSQISTSSFSGNAADVSIADAGNKITATDVEGALQELAGSIATLNGNASTTGSVAKALSDAIGELKIGTTDYSTVKAYVDAMCVAVKHLIDANTGDLTNLTTTAKTDLVSAINEVKSAVGGVDYSGKADKVTSATAGNFAGLDSNGNLTDSGKKAADFEAAGAAAAVLGTSTDAAGTATVYGVKASVDALGTAASSNVATTAIALDTTDASLPTAAQVATFVKGQVAGVTGALHFKGIKTATSDVTDAASGDVIIIGTTEYIYDGSAWKELGDEGNYVPKARTVAGIDLVDDITVAELETVLSLSSYAKSSDIEAITEAEIIAAFNGTT